MATMASQLKDVMDSSFGGYDYPIVGYLGSDQLLPNKNGASDGADLFAVFEHAAVHTSTESFEFDHGILRDSGCTGSLLESNDIFSHDVMGLGCLDGNSVFDLESLVAEAPVTLPLAQQETETLASSTSSLADFSFSTWSGLDSTNEISSFQEQSSRLKTACESSAPGSPDSGFYSVQSPCSSAMEDEPSPCPTPALVLDAKAPVTLNLDVSADDIQYLETLLEESANSDTTTASRLGSHSLATVSLFLPPCDKIPIKSPSPKSRKDSGRPSKLLTTTEKKEKKRAQNKNAATRYREKRRAEAKVVFEEQSKMEDKNRDLKDKVTLLSREIQYMKELLIEVYKTKGLVE